MKFRCRTIKPSVSPWREVEADSAAEAANNFHEAGVPGVNAGSAIVLEEDSKKTQVWFALVQIEGHGEMISRVYYGQMWRKGGIRPVQPTIKDVAEAIGWTGDPKELLDEGWEGEESWDAARDRKLAARLKTPR